MSATSLRIAASVAASALALTLAVRSGATIVERVVAVVGERAILLSDLRHRAEPFLLRIEQQVPPGAQRAAATSQLYGQLLERIIDEELEERAASRANLSVTTREVDDALARIATQNSLTVQAVVDEAKRSGLSERQYRQEIRRQLLEAKLLNLRIQGRLRIGESDLEGAYEKLVQEERRQLAFRAAWIRLRAPRSNTSSLKAQRDLADQLVERARAGESFASLAREYSDDVATRESGGLLAQLKPGQLTPAVDTAAIGLEVGGVSEPVRDGDHLAIVNLVEREESRLPPFEEARNELSQRVYMEKMETARRHWLDGLRRQIHVDIRL
jgi:peptidyl-prolyl cis-trans isomerase SurA